VISGTGEIDEDYEAPFMALRQVVTEHEHAQFFLDGQHSDQHGLWQLARRHHLLENMSIVPRRLGHREMLLNADALIHPQPLGKSRTLTLQAMGNGLPVIARDDPWVDYLLDDETAWLVRKTEPAPWAECLGRRIVTPDAARQLGGRARQWVMQQRPLSRHVELTLSLYRQVAMTGLRFGSSR
jgi:glycosyltransferase involved in cell wall biosynthesis